MSGPSFDELMEGATPDDQARLRRVHELLVAAGPPPELPPNLAKPPLARVERPPVLTTLPRRRFGAMLTAAAGIAAAAFLVGYLVNNGGSGGNAPVVNIAMKSTPVAPQSAAVLALEKGHGDENIPMTLTVSGLKTLPKGGYYELWLTRAGKGGGGATTQQRIVSCGTFVVSSDRVVVKMNAPYRLDNSPGWVITRHVPGANSDPVVLTT